VPLIYILVCCNLCGVDYYSEDVLYKSLFYLLYLLTYLTSSSTCEGCVQPWMSFALSDCFLVNNDFHLAVLFTGMHCLG